MLRVLGQSIDLGQDDDLEVVAFVVRDAAAG
jgi:hypothetical protein